MNDPVFSKAKWPNLGFAMAYSIVGLLLSAAPTASYAFQPIIPPAPITQPGQIEFPVPEHKSDELLVKLKPGVSSSAISATVAAYGVANMNPLSVPKAMAGLAIARWHVAKLAPGQDEKKVVGQLKADANIESVEYNYKRSATATPNDPRFSDLWGMNNTGQTGGIVDADIDAPEAWDTSTGADVIVAVIDTGVDYTHEDLADNIWTNPGEIPANGIDDDVNGYVDDVHGYDFWSNDGDAQDEFGHGTHVAGTIAAVGNNGVGVAGVSWKSKIMSVRFLGPDGGGYDDAAVKSILYAVANGAKVTNNSWGGGGYSSMLYDAISAANEKGVAFAAAAGNYGGNNDGWQFYPASYDLPNIIAVAATNYYDQYSYFSNFGKVTVDIAAPGEYILSTVPNRPMWLWDPSGYMWLNGTSMATPHVAGAAAQLFGQNPARTVVGVKNLMMDTGDAITDLYGRDTASGARLNLANALNCDATKLNLRVKSPVDKFFVQQGTKIPVQSSVTSCGAAVSDASMRASFSNGQPDLELLDDGLHDDGQANDGTFGGTWIADVSGDATVTITAKSPSLGTSSKSVSGVIHEKIFYTSEKVSYSWIDQSPYAVRVSMRDDDSIYWYVGFPFQFYGVNHDTVQMSSNGFLSFVDYAFQYENQSLPNPARPNGVIAPFWDDLKPSDGNVFVQYDGVAPNRQTTFSWVKAGHFDAPTGTVTFQVTLYEGRSDIVFQYKDTSFENKLLDGGASATVGVESADGLEGTQYSYNQASVSDGTALRFSQHYFNKAPVADVGGPYASTRLTPAVFDGSKSSDPEGAMLTYAWDFGDGTTGSGVSPAHQYTSLGNFNVSLVVSDGKKTSAAASTTASIANVAPTANAGADQIVRRSVKSVSLSGAGSSDKDGSIASYAWKQVSGPAVTLSTPSAVTTEFAMPKNITVPSVLVFELVVADNDGAKSADQVSITVTK